LPGKGQFGFFILEKTRMVSSWGAPREQLIFLLLYKSMPCKEPEERRLGVKSSKHYFFVGNLVPDNFYQAN
jgi:hypothetical protein